MPAPPDNLLETCLETAAANIHTYASLDCLPEDLVLVLFGMVLERGKLTPRVLQVFRDTQYASLVDNIESLKLRDPPPLVCNGHDRWLHQKPGWY